MPNIIIPTKDNPTPPSRKAWGGAIWGQIAAIIPSALATFFINPLVGMAVTVGAMIGGYFIGNSKGEHLKEKELSEGKKEVKEPTIWNRGLAKGWVIGSTIGIATSALRLFAFKTGVIGALMSCTSLLATVGLMIGGSINAKKEMTKEYAQAQQIAEAEHQQAMVAAIGRGHAQQPQYAQAPQTEPTKFTQTENERRAKAQQTQITPV